MWNIAPHIHIQIYCISLASLSLLPFPFIRMLIPTATLQFPAYYTHMTPAVLLTSPSEVTMLEYS